jgi:hypothetical protein
MTVSTLKPVKNASFRPIKNFPEGSVHVTQLEYSDADSFESIFVKTASTAIKHDDGIVLLINCSKVNGVQVEFELDRDFDNIPRSMCFLLHSKPYKTWKWSKELGKSEQLEIAPTKFELAMIAYLEPRVGHVYEGNIFLNSGHLTSESINDEVFQGGTWHTDGIDNFPHLNTAYKEYGTGKNSGGGGYKDFKTFQQKVDERIKALAPLVWELTAVPGHLMPTDVPLSVTTFRCLKQLDPVELAAIELMLPKS